MKKLLGIMLGIVVVAAMSVYAAEGGAKGKGKAEGKGGHGAPGAAFAKMDTNGDGSLNLEEFVAARSKAGALDEKKKAGVEKQFKAMDADSDGKLTKEEMATWQKAHPPKAKPAEGAAAPAADKK